MSRSRHFTRRRLLQVGAIGSLGLDLPTFLRSHQTRARDARAAGVDSCILIFYYGGPSHLDTWDMKPDAPAEIRGEFKQISTSVPGLQISEHLAGCAKVMHHIGLVHTLHHQMQAHITAVGETLTGRTPPGGDNDLGSPEKRFYPALGSTISYLSRDEGHILPHVALPHTMWDGATLIPGQTAGFLGPAYERFQVEADPNADHFSIASNKLPAAMSLLDLPADLSSQRMAQREAMRVLFNRQRSGLDRIAKPARLARFYEKACSILSSKDVRKAFDIADEDTRTRDRYGRNKHGQSVLLARRLVEAGVRFVTVFDHAQQGDKKNWDSHTKNFSDHRDRLLPPADRALSALIEDLQLRGRLQSTLVVALGEFGRTPRINKNAGRDHWPACFTAVLAGGGINGGQRYGQSDQIGAYPHTNPVTPGDFAATLFWRLGIDPKSPIRDPFDRSHPAAEGAPLRTLFA